MADTERPPFEGLVAIVTGGGATPAKASSIGEATCRLLARRGAKIVVGDINGESANETVRRIAAEGGEATAVVADLSQEGECRTMVEQAMGRFGRLDVIVNNLGVSDGGSVLEIEEAAWDRSMAINLKSALFLSKHGIPRMAAGGAIVNVSSTAIDKPSSSVAYSASKGALEALTKQIAVQHGPDGVRCNAVRPGEAWTAMVERHFKTEEAAQRLRNARLRRTALLAEGDAWDIAEAIAFLAGPGARWITGQTLIVDGGSTYVRSASDWTSRNPAPIADRTVAGDSA